MKFSNAIIFVPNPSESAAFFEKAFGFEREFEHSTGYVELRTGTTAIGFSPLAAAREVVGDVVAACDSAKPLGMEFVLTADDVEAAFDRAIAAGASPVARPALKPWGQTLSWLRCPDGTLVEIISQAAHN